MEGLFSKLDSYVSNFMEPVFNAIRDFLMGFFSKGGEGAYIVLLLLGLFLVVLILIGLIKFLRKFGLFLLFCILTVGVSAVWYFYVFK